MWHGDASALRAGFSLNWALFRKKCGAPNILYIYEYRNRFSNLVARLHSDAEMAM